MVSFAGQVVVITGGGGGLGSAFAKEIARRGGAVVVNDLGGSVSGAPGTTSRDYADAVVAAITAAGGSAVANGDDVATSAGADRIIAEALRHYGRLDAVIANAGTIRYGSFDQLTADDLASLLAVHVAGAWNIAKAAWPEMSRRGYGRIVFATSSGGTLGNAALTAYGTAKGGVMGLMHGLAEAGRPHGILCNAYMPNAISRMTSGIAPSDLGDNPWAAAMGRYFDPDYATGLVTYLASGACQSDHGIYSILGGRIGRVFIGVTDGIIADAPLNADEIAGRWPEIGDLAGGFGIPANQLDEWRLVADRRGL